MIVLDASIIFKWIVKNEDYRDRAIKLLERHMEGTEEILVPELLFYEIANVLATRTKTSDSAIRKGIMLLYESSFNVYAVDRNLLLEAAFLAKKHKTSVYDMVYAVIAKHKKSFLITADEGFIKKINFPFVKSIKDYKVE